MHVICEVIAACDERWLLMQAKVGEDPFARTPALSQEFEDLLNHGIAYHLSAANSADSAAAYFGM